jgi:hypothetical protein
MKLRYPFEFLTLRAQKWAFGVLFVLSLILMVSLQILGAPLITAEAPLGIISFELAGDLELARNMIASWGPEGQVYAGLNLGLDYLFMVAYAGAIALGCMLAAQSLAERVPPLAYLGAVLAWGQVGAALLDALENYALIHILLGSEQEMWALIARWSALPKFAIVFCGIFYVLLGAVICLAIKPKSVIAGSAG